MQRGERAQEAAVRLVLPRDRALTAPARAAQRVEPAVVAGAGVGVGLDARWSAPSASSASTRPGQRGRRVGGGDGLLALSPARQPGGGGVVRQVGLRDAEQAAVGGQRHAWGAGRAQVLAGLDDAGGHARLGLLAPGARVVLLLVADLAVDLQHAVVVLQHPVGDRAGERVLGVGVDVHLDDAVVDRRRDLLGQRAGAAVEDEVERLVVRACRTPGATASWPP